MADPVGISVAFDDGPLIADPAWTRLDTTDNLIARYSVRRGRTDEFARTGTGTATIEANDTQGVFDPTNPGSPYAGKLDGKQAALALHDPVADTWSTIFRGDIDDYQHVLDPSQLVSRVTIPLVDKLDYLAGIELQPGKNGEFIFAGPPRTAEQGSVAYPATTFDTVDERIVAVLLEAGWPTVTAGVLDLAEVFTGNVKLQRTIYSPGTSLLTPIDEAADAEFPGIANRYINKLGEFTFHGRLARFNYTDPQYHITVWKAGDGAAILADSDYAQIRGLGFSRPRANIINSSAISPQGVSEGDKAGLVVTDPTSIAAYGLRSYSAPDLRISESVLSGNNAADECLLYSNYYIATYKDPQTRVNQIVIRSLDPSDPRAAQTWALMCGVDISDVIHLNTTHPGGGGFDDLFFVEGITYDIQPLQPGFANVTLTLDVTPQTYYPGDFDWTGA